MKRIVALLILVSLISSGCAAVDVYTFKKDRVDQSIQGNQGYIEGEAPVSTDTRNPERTLIGIDIELSGSDSEYEEEYVPAKAVQSTSRKTAQQPVTVKKVTVVEEEYVPAKAVQSTSRKTTQQSVTVKKVTVVEEEWIK